MWQTHRCGFKRRSAVALRKARPRMLQHSPVAHEAAIRSPTIKINAQKRQAIAAAKVALCRSINQLAWLPGIAVDTYLTAVDRHQLQNILLLPVQHRQAMQSIRMVLTGL